MPLTFFSYSFLLCPLPSDGFSLRRYLFSSVDAPSLSYPSLLSFCGWWPQSRFCVPWFWFLSLLILCLYAYASLPYFSVFLIAASTSSLSVLGQHPCGFSSYPPLLPRSDLGSFAMGLPFGTSQLLRLVPSPPSPDFLVGLCTQLPSFRCRFLSVSLPLLFWPSVSSSLPFPCAIFWYVASLGLSSYIWSFLRLCLSCSSHRCMLGGFPTFGAVLMVSYGFPCGVLFILMHLLPFLCYYVVSLFRSLSFSLGVGAPEVRFTLHSPLVIVRHLRCCGCLAWRSSALAPSPLDRCVYGDSLSPGSLPYRYLCLW